MYGEAMGPEMMAPDAAAPELEAAPELTEEETALAEAFPDLAADPERLGAIQTAFRLCIEKVLAEREPDTESKKGSKSVPPSGKPGSLALIFGDKK